MEHFDVIVAGGGIAGATTAAALAQQGHSVLLCEAGLPSDRRLAGELVHPPGAANLDRLGLLPALEAAGAVPGYGFAVFRAADDPGTVLSYSEIPGGRPAGIALEHAVLTRTLLEAVGEKPGVTIWEARVLDADLESERPVVRIGRDGEEVRVSTRLVVSAQGRRSKLRERSGIEAMEEPPFRMVGYKVSGGRLPFPGYGHVFIGGPGPTLAYQVSRSEVRIMFELELDEGKDVPRSLLEALPQPFREDVERTIETATGTTARVVGFRPSRFTARNLAVVGDAGGCVHPLTASGISFCTSDAVRLADAIGADIADVEAGLRRYEQARRGPMATRAALGPAMVEALCDPDPSMRLLRHGLFRYWSRSPRGRSASMGLLSTRESRLTVMAREYAIVCANALAGLRGGGAPIARDQALWAVVGLARRSAGFALSALKS